jgi:hypothetical protein
MKYTFSMFSAACGGLVFLERERERDSNSVENEAARGRYWSPPGSPTLGHPS